jgi:hypothetical protein
VNLLTDAALWADLAIALTVLETLVLGWRSARLGRGLAPRELALNALAGIGLLLALRAALAARPALIAVALMFAGLAHLADLRERSRRSA